VLSELRSTGSVSHNFRLFVDLQGFTPSEIPDSFLFNYSVSFYLTEKNNEDMEGFNDIWANILNDKILVELTNYDVKPG